MKTLTNGKASGLGNIPVEAFLGECTGVPEETV